MSSSGFSQSCSLLSCLGLARSAGVTPEHSSAFLCGQTTALKTNAAVRQTKGRRAAGGPLFSAAALSANCY